MSSRSAQPEPSNGAWKVWLPLGLLAVAAFSVTALFVGPAPPDTLVLATGPETGAYHRFGAGYRDALAVQDIEIVLRPTAGSVENLSLLQSGAVDLAFVQGGTVPDASDGLEGLASLYYEPLWVFHRSDLPLVQLSELAGRRIQVGAPGSGTRAVAEELLAANGVDASTATFVELAPEPAADELLAGRLDALLLVSSPASATVRRLMAQEGGAIRLLDVERSRSYSQIFRYLRPVLLREGMMDLGRNLPDRDVHLVSPTAGLVATDALHPALAPLFIEAARGLHGSGGLFEATGEFPSPSGLDAPLAVAADHYYRSGPSFLYRVLPFRVAAMIDRLKIMLLPLLTLLFPLLKVAPPLYRWRIRSKIYRWYRDLRAADRQLHGAAGTVDAAPILQDLQRVRSEIIELKVPPSYAEELYNLRMHVARVQGLVERAAEEQADRALTRRPA